MRAVIDIGSNSVLLLIGERRDDGLVRVCRDECRITRLSEGASASGKFSAKAMARTLAVLDEYAKICRSYQLIPRVLATEGVRMASEPDQFLRPANEVLGTQVEVISGADEARSSYVSVALEVLPEVSHEELRVLDIGGASTELSVGRGHEYQDLISHPIGSVRLTEALLHHDPPTEQEMAKLEYTVREEFVKQPLAPFPKLYGLAGTVTTCAALILRLQQYERTTIDASEFSFGQVLELRDQLAAETTAQRQKRKCLEPGRADVIVAGATILVEAMRHCGASILAVKDRGFRYAYL